MVQNWPVQLEMHSNNCKVFAGMAQCPLGGCNNYEWKGALTGLIERDRSVNVMTGWKEFYAHRNSILAQKKWGRSTHLKKKSKNAQTVCKLQYIRYNSTDTLDTGRKAKIHNTQSTILYTEYKVQHTVYTKQDAIDKIQTQIIDKKQKENTE